MNLNKRSSPHPPTTTRGPTDRGARHNLLLFAAVTRFVRQRLGGPVSVLWFQLHTVPLSAVATRLMMYAGKGFKTIVCICMYIRAHAANLGVRCAFLHRDGLFGDVWGGCTFEFGAATSDAISA